MESDHILQVSSPSSFVEAVDECAHFDIQRLRFCAGNSSFFLDSIDSNGGDWTVFSEQRSVYASGRVTELRTKCEQVEAGVAGIIEMERLQPQPHQLLFPAVPAHPCHALLYRICAVILVPHASLTDIKPSSIRLFKSVASDFPFLLGFPNLRSLAAAGRLFLLFFESPLMTEYLLSKPSTLEEIILVEESFLRLEAVVKKVDERTQPGKLKEAFQEAVQEAVQVAVKEALLPIQQQVGSMSEDIAKILLALNVKR